MSKEQTLVDAIVVESNEVAIQTELTMLDDLSLALIGGGTMVVQF